MIIRYSDLEIENVMIEVGLENALWEKTLNYKIVEDGINLSFGEKRLICIARALLRKSKVVLMMKPLQVLIIKQLL